MEAELHIDRARVVAFRLAGHRLIERLPKRSLLKAFAASGVRNTRGTPFPALAARVEDVQQTDLERALLRKDVVEVLSARTGATIVPSVDLDVFTIGVAPSDEESLRVALKPFLRTFDSSDFQAEKALELACDVARDALANGPLEWAELAAVMTRTLPSELVPRCRGRCPDPHVEDILFRLVSLSGVWCFEPGSGALIRTDQWLGRVPDPSKRAEARDELLRRYLACNGPTTPADFAAWAGISNADAKRSLESLRDQLIEVRRGTRTRAWIHKGDLDRLSSPRSPKGARLLPRNDPYLQGRDRDATLPDRASQRKVWRATSSPGAILFDAELAGTWRAQAKGGSLDVKLEPFGSLSRRALKAITEEAEILATARGLASARVAAG